MEQQNTSHSEMNKYEEVSELSHNPGASFKTSFLGFDKEDVVAYIDGLVRGVSEQKNHLEASLNRLTDQNRDLIERVNRYEQRIHRIQKELDGEKLYNQDSHEREGLFKKAIAVLQEKVAFLQHNTVSPTGGMDASIEEQTQRANEMALRLREELLRKDENISRLSEELSRRNDIILNQDKILADKDKQVVEQAKDLEEQKQQLLAKTDEIHRLTEQVASLRNRIGILEQKRNEIMEELNAAHAKLRDALLRQQTDQEEIERVRQQFSAEREEIERFKTQQLSELEGIAHVKQQQQQEHERVEQLRQQQEEEIERFRMQQAAEREEFQRVRQMQLSEHEEIARVKKQQQQEHERMEQLRWQHQEENQRLLQLQQSVQRQTGLMEQAKKKLEGESDALQRAKEQLRARTEVLEQRIEWQKRLEEDWMRRGEERKRADVPYSPTEGRRPSYESGYALPENEYSYGTPYFERMGQEGVDRHQQYYRKPLSEVSYTEKPVGYGRTPYNEPESRHVYPAADGYRNRDAETGESHRMAEDFRVNGGYESRDFEMGGSPRMADDVKRDPFLSDSPYRMENPAQPPYRVDDSFSYYRTSADAMPPRPYEADMVSRETNCRSSYQMPYQADRQQPFYPADYPREGQGNDPLPREAGEYGRSDYGNY